MLGIVMKILYILITLLIFSTNLLANDQTEISGYYTNKIIANDMAPTLEAGELISSNPSYYDENPILRNDIILFQSPKEDGKLWIKRVIGLPGETVTVKFGKIYINSEELLEKYVNDEKNQKVSLKMNKTLVLRENQYYVLGDNRDNSYDSRFLGPINKELIKAKAIRIYFSSNITRIGKIE